MKPWPAIVCSVIQPAMRWWPKISMIAHMPTAGAFALS
jgi:hypothetical protein